MAQDTTSTALLFFDYFSDFKIWITVYSIIVSIIGAIKLTQRQVLLWRTRKLRKVWGIKNGDHVILICTELDEAETRQNFDPREFYYHFKYGDVDAYIEAIITLLRLFPKIKLRILSSGEAIKTKIDMAQTMVLIGGPDYNALTKEILEKNITQFYYRSPYVKEQSKMFPNEIAIYHKPSDREFCEQDDLKDYGYFERINNPENPQKKIIIFGGCHAIGVTAVVKAFSLSSSEHGDIPNVVMENSKIVAKKINKSSEFSIIIKAKRIGQSINTPIIKDDSIFISKKDNK